MAGAPSTPGVRASIDCGVLASSGPGEGHTLPEPWFSHLQIEASNLRAADRAEGGRALAVPTMRGRTLLWGPVTTHYLPPAAPKSQFLL